MKSMSIIKQRISYIVIFFSMCLGLVAWRSYTLAFNSHGNKARAAVLRGAIYDRNGFALAVSEEASTIALAPSEIYDFEQSAELLAKFLDMSSREILQAIYERKKRRYFYLKRQVDNFKADQIMDMALPGVYREREYRRHYPGKSLASNLLGFVGREQSKALAGIERNFNTVLLHSVPSAPNSKGSTLQLSIDSLLQYHLEQELAKAYAASESKRAAAILMDTETGAILAMVSLPNFNPNEYWKSRPFERGNWNIRLNYEPGSTIKIIMAAILFAQKAVRPSQRFLCEGEIHFHESTVRCRQRGKAVRHGYLNISEIIEKSCNVGIIKAMRKVKAKHLYRYMQDLGFGQETGIFPPGAGETSAYFPNLKNWVASTSYYMPIGQGFSVTPIQLLRAGASLVNGGKLLRPFVAWRIRSSESNAISNEQQSIWKRSPFDESINRKVRRIMERVVSRGTGKAAQVPRLGALGKTGTGEKSSAQGYLDKYVVSFMGFFPLKKPRYGALILFDEPALKHSGSSLAAPVFGSFVRKVAPFLESRNHSIVPQKLPPSSVQRWKAKKDRLYDLRGLASRDAVQIVSGFYKLKVDLSGSGYVYRQHPPPGTPTIKLKKVRLYMNEHLAR